MSPDAALWLSVAAGYLAAFLTAFLLARLNFIKLPSQNGRFGCLDGLRGYLALAVFFMHFMTTYYWKQGEGWKTVPEHELAQMAQLGVALFFMITGFLFIQKILTAGKNINWRQLYVSRIVRIYPLYLFAVVILFAISYAQTGFMPQTGIVDFLARPVSWLLFLGGPVNGYEDSKLVIAGVHWTLRYELLFYLSLPILAWFIHHSRNSAIFMVAAVFIVSLLPINFPLINNIFFLFFLTGGLVAWLVFSKHPLLQYGRHWLFGAVGLVGLLGVTLFWHDVYSLVPALCIVPFFIAVVAGNSFGGLLTKDASVFLGEISFSLYLIHGMVLYFIFTIFWAAEAKGMDYVQFVSFAPLIAVAVVIVSAITYRFIEKPAMEWHKKMRKKEAVTPSE